MAESTFQVNGRGGSPRPAGMWSAHENLVPYEIPYVPHELSEPVPLPGEPAAEKADRIENGAERAVKRAQRTGRRAAVEDDTATETEPSQPESLRSVSSSALTADALIRSSRRAPSAGWRRAVYTATFGLVHLGESRAELERRELVATVRTPLAGGHHRVAVLSLKGGVGKTTTTVALGSMLASLRGDRVLAVDANPDRGTLSDKVCSETPASLRDLLNEREHVFRYADIRAFTSQAASRLEILASDRDPAVSEAFSEADYREVSRILERFYSIALTDCGTGLLHSAMRGVLGLADQIVLVSPPSLDGARSASATLDWLRAHGHAALVRDAVVVLSMVSRNGKSTIDLNRLEDHFADRCRAVVQVPWDAHLEQGAEVDLDRLHPATRHAYLRLAATVAETFAGTRSASRL